MNKKYKEYLLSDEWAQLKIDLFNHRGRNCERCNSNKKISVHHLTYDNIFNEEPEDLIILCQVCHDKAHGKKTMVKPKRKSKKAMAKKPKRKKSTMAFIKDGNTTMVITRKKI